VRLDVAGRGREGRRIRPLCDAANTCFAGDAELIVATPSAPFDLPARLGLRLGCAWLGDPPPRPAGYRMTTLLADYLPLVIFIGVSLVIAAALLIAPFVVAYKQPDPEKLSAYECGFNAFDDARMKFDVRFYLVAILFIIFDLEVAFLFPWAITFGGLGWYGFWSMMIFLAVLTVGFVYEWKKGALEWD
jgi:NADH-quinone oxidoreductase subunit A